MIMRQKAIITAGLCRKESHRTEGRWIQVFFIYNGEIQATGSAGPLELVSILSKPVDMIFGMELFLTKRKINSPLQSSCSLGKAI